MHFEIFQDVNGGWRWNAKYRNGKSAGNGAEPFASERNVRRAIRMFCDALIDQPFVDANVRVVERGIDGDV